MKVTEMTNPKFQDWLDQEESDAAPTPSKISPMMRMNLAMSDPSEPAEVDLMKRAEKLYVDKFGTNYQNALKAGRQ